ncbi:hypothetical protein Ccrd_025925, partial [Cynara cardunculus var. scolymus]
KEKENEDLIYTKGSLLLFWFVSFVVWRLFQPLMLGVHVGDPRRLESERPSEGDGNMRTEQVRSMAADTRGKHRISAALKRLEQETHSIQQSKATNLTRLVLSSQISNNSPHLYVGFSMTLKQGRIPCSPQQMVQQLRYGIDGSKGHKISLIVDAGYCDHGLCHFIISCIETNVVLTKYYTRRTSVKKRQIHQLFSSFLELTGDAFW